MKRFIYPSAFTGFVFCYLIIDIIWLLVSLHSKKEFFKTITYVVVSQIKSSHVTKKINNNNSTIVIIPSIRLDFVNKLVTWGEFISEGTILLLDLF